MFRGSMQSEVHRGENRFLCMHLGLKFMHSVVNRGVGGACTQLPVEMRGGSWAWLLTLLCAHSLAHSEESRYQHLQESPHNGEGDPVHALAGPKK